MKNTPNKQPVTWAEAQTRISDLEVFLEKLYQHHEKAITTIRKGNTQHDAKHKGGRT